MFKTTNLFYCKWYTCMSTTHTNMLLACKHKAPSKRKAQKVGCTTIMVNWLLVVSLQLRALGAGIELKYRLERGQWGLIGWQLEKKYCYCSFGGLGFVKWNYANSSNGHILQTRWHSVQSCRPTYLQILNQLIS